LNSAPVLNCRAHGVEAHEAPSVFDERAVADNQSGVGIVDKDSARAVCYVTAESSLSDQHHATGHAKTTGVMSPIVFREPALANPYIAIRCEKSANAFAILVVAESAPNDGQFTAIG